MNKEKLLQTWLQEENLAHIHGWDFSHIHGRYEEENDLPWDYEAVLRRFLRPEMKLLDLDTGGAEFLLSLHHPYANLAATENYPPNVALCKEKLLPLGIDFRQADAGAGPLPFADRSFDMVINRHGNFRPAEVARVLKPDGLFITQQVGAENDRELVALLLKNPPPLPFPRQYLALVRKSFEEARFSTVLADEAFCPIRFYDVGALVWFARIIEWEFPGFCVKDCLPELIHAQEILEADGVIKGRIHRFLLAVRKPSATLKKMPL